MAETSCALELLVLFHRIISLLSITSIRAVLQNRERWRPGGEHSTRESIKLWPPHFPKLRIGSPRYIPGFHRSVGMFVSPINWRKDVDRLLVAINISSLRDSRTHCSIVGSGSLKAFTSAQRPELAQRFIAR